MHNLRYIANVDFVAVVTCENHCWAAAVTERGKRSYLSHTATSPLKILQTYFER
jgi:hypothetical protein